MEERVYQDFKDKRVKLVYQGLMADQVHQDPQVHWDCKDLKVTKDLADVLELKALEDHPEVLDLMDCQDLVVKEVIEDPQEFLELKEKKVNVV